MLPDRPIQCCLILPILLPKYICKDRNAASGGTESNLKNHDIFRFLKSLSLEPEGTLKIQVQFWILRTLKISSILCKYYDVYFFLNRHTRIGDEEGSRKGLLVETFKVHLLEEKYFE